jgi:rhodanese-related sulfurtransferase
MRTEPGRAMHPAMHPEASGGTPRCLILLLALLLALPACGQDLKWKVVKENIRRDFPTVEHISTDSLRALQQAGNVGLHLLDVRGSDEYAVSHLADAHRVEPGTEDLSFLGDLPRDTPIVAYCSVGYRSSELVSRLRDAGFTKVVNLEGSIFEWANKGYPVYRDGAPVRAVHPYDALWGTLLNPELRARE